MSTVRNPKSKLLFLVVVLVLVCMTTVVSVAGPVFYGQQFGSRWDNQGKHNYVTFRVNLCSQRGWSAEAPWWPWRLDPQLWNPPDSSGYAEVGFRWPDWPPPGWFLRPSSFRLYPK